MGVRVGVGAGWLCRIKKASDTGSGAWTLTKGVRGRRTLKLLVGEGPAELFCGASGAGWVLAVRRR